MMTRRLISIGLGAAIVVAILVAFGAEPFVRGLTSLTPASVAAAVLLTGVSTTAAALRWRAVARGLGLPLRLGDAVAACYRSQFLNSVLPGGVLGDVHRAYRHGVSAGATADSARAVVTERVAGQVVQFALAAVVLGVLGLTSPLQGMAVVAGVVVGVLALAVVVLLCIPRTRRAVTREAGRLRQVFAAPRRTLVVLGSSVVVVAALSTMFVIACLAVGVTAPVGSLVALALIALTAAALPLNLAGWGPREAVAASAFAVVGLGAQAGIAASTAFGALSLIGVLPGALVLLLDRPRTEESPA